jgi:hypothetical protein
MFGSSSTRKRLQPLRSNKDPLAPHAKMARRGHGSDDLCIEPLQVEAEKRLVRRINSREKARAAKIWRPDPRFDKAEELAPKKRAKSGGRDPHSIFARPGVRKSRAGDEKSASFAVSAPAPSHARDGLSGSGGRQGTTSAAHHELPVSQRRPGLTVGGWATSAT